MKGGGRFARSKRSPKPDTDLKAAARGAAILTRALVATGLSRFRSALLTKSAPRAAVSEPTHPWIAKIERYASPKIGAAATAAMFVATIGFGMVRGNHVAELTAIFDEFRNGAANSVGFRIAAVSVNGRQQLTQDEVLAIGGINGHSSLLFLDATTVREKLKANPWIADANVLKFYPGRLQIDITERKPFAVWQQGGRLSVIANDGAVLETYVARRFVNLPLVVGSGAQTRARDFLATLDRYPQLRSQTSAAILVGERRWNLRLADGVNIRLPEFDVGRALETLSALDKDDRLLARDIESVDMRLPDRITVRLSEDAAKARDELFKDRKPKRKANDA